MIPGIVVGPGDQLGGLDGVLLTAFAKDHGLELKLYQTTFASMILAVEQKKIDVGTYVFYPRSGRSTSSIPTRSSSATPSSIP